VATADVPVFKNKGKPLIMWADNKFDFTEREVKNAIDMWQHDIDIEDIAHTIRKGADGYEETLLLVLYLLHKGYIKPRAKSIIIGGLQ
jgi:hypothetical protein